MRAGKMRHRIQVLAQPSGRDASGQITDGGDPVVVLTCWAAIRAASSREIYVLGGAGFDGEVTHAITIRYPAVPLAAGMTIAFDGRTFRLQTTVDPDEFKRELDLMCLEIGK